MEKNNVQPQINPEGDGYEKRDVNLAKVLIYGLLGIAVLVVIVFFVLDYFTAASEEAIYEAQLKPESVALRELRAREDEELNSYAVLDAQKGIYRIPIERAMELIAEEAYRARVK